MCEKVLCLAFLVCFSSSPPHPSCWSPLSPSFLLLHSLSYFNKYTVICLKKTNLLTQEKPASFSPTRGKGRTDALTQASFPLPSIFSPPSPPLSSLLLSPLQIDILHPPPTPNTPFLTPLIQLHTHTPTPKSAPPSSSWPPATQQWGPTCTS